MKKLFIVLATLTSLNICADELSDAIKKSDLNEVSTILLKQELSDKQKAMYIDLAESVIELRKDELINGTALYSKGYTPTSPDIKILSPWGITTLLGSAASLGLVGYNAVEMLFNNIYKVENRYQLIGDCVHKLYMPYAAYIILNNFFRAEQMFALKKLHNDALSIKELLLSI